MYKELLVSADIPAKKLMRAFKTGKLSLTKAELQGSGATIHLHPESYEKVAKAKKRGVGTRLCITRHEIGYPMKHLDGSGVRGGSIWTKIWNGIKSAYKWAKDSGVLTKIADAAVAPIAALTGQPGAVVAARSGLKTLTGIGVEDEPAGEGIKEVVASVRKSLKKAKDSGLLTRGADFAESELLRAAPQYTTLIKTGRKALKHYTGIGLPSNQVNATPSTSQRKPRMAKGSAEAISYMAKLRSLRKPRIATGGSFRLE